MVAEPKLTPVTTGCEMGAVAPAAMDTVNGATVTLVGSLLVRVTVTPLAGAGLVKLTANGRDCVGPRVTLPVRVMVPEAAATLVSVKTAGITTPAADAVTG